MKSRSAFAIAIVCLLNSSIWAATFVHSSGTTNPWNNDANWGEPFPTGSGAIAVFPAATGTLTVDLGQSITVGSLTVNKGSGNFTTTIGVGTTNTLTFDGGSSTLLNGNNAAATGLTTIAAPVVLTDTAMPASTFTVTQAGASALDFTGGISGTGNVSINRDSAGSGAVILSAANSYVGTTTVTGQSNNDWLPVRLNHANAIPASSNLSLSAGVLELAAGDFLRPIGTGAGEIKFSGTNRNGWAAVGGNRVVNLGGASAPISWDATGPSAFNQLILGTAASSGTLDFQNPISLATAGTNHIVRTYDGSATLEAKFSNTISGPGNLRKEELGTLSLAAANTYTGPSTILQNGILRLDHPQALPSTTNLQVGSGAVLGIGADTTADVTNDFARNLGTAAGEIQLTAIGGGGNAANAGFAAFGGNRIVVLSGNAPLTWGTGNFLSGGTGSPNRNFFLSAPDADGTLEFKNPINLNAASSTATRTVIAQNGSAGIDGKLSGVISGTGGITKDNPGTLEFSNANTYNGPTRITGGGAILLTNATSIPGGINGGNTANIEINTSSTNIGVLGLGAGDFTSPLGSGAGQFQIIGSGGFAAFGANRAVNIGGQVTPTQLTWGGANFLDPTTGRLALGIAAADSTIDFRNPIELNGAVQRSLAIRNGTANIDAVISGVLSGTGSSIDKQGGGTLSLTAANTFTGGMFMNEGRLLVNNTTGSGVGTGDVSVTAGTLGGGGLIGTSGDASNVSISSGAHLAPGSSAGNLTVFGDVSLASGSFCDVELGGLTAGTDFDKLSVNAAAPSTGQATLSGTLNVTLINGFMPAGGNSFEILSAAGGVTGTFSSVVLPTVAGVTLQVAYNSNSVVINAIAAGLPGDFNSDGKVDAGDYVTWRKNDGTNNALANDNGLGTPVGAAHYNLWRANFGNPPGSGSGGSLSDGQVPEPSTIVLLGLIVPLFVLRKRGWIGK